MSLYPTLFWGTRAPAFFTCADHEKKETHQMDLLRRKKPAFVDGHRVLFVDAKGPAANAGLVPYLDLITEIAPEGQLVSGGRQTQTRLTLLHSGPLSGPPSANRTTTTRALLLLLAATLSRRRR